MELLHGTRMNIFSNFILNKIKALRDSDPLCRNDDTKSILNLNHKLYHRYLRHKKNNEFAKLKDLRNGIDNLMSKSKKEFYQNITRKLNDPSKSSKTYRAIVNPFFKGKKVPAIPLLLFGGACITDLQ